MASEWEFAPWDSVLLLLPTSTEDLPDWRASKEVDGPKLGEQLSSEQKKEIEANFRDVLQSKPGRTDLTEHSIDMGSARPIRLPPYKIPHAYRESVERELKEMEESEVIEPSQSEWSSPIVIVKKKMGIYEYVLTSESLIQLLQWMLILCLARMTWW